MCNSRRHLMLVQKNVRQQISGYRQEEITVSVRFSSLLDLVVGALKGSVMPSLCLIRSSSSCLLGEKQIPGIAPAYLAVQAELLELLEMSCRMPSLQMRRVESALASTSSLFDLSSQNLGRCCVLKLMGFSASHLPRSLLTLPLPSLP